MLSRFPASPVRDAERPRLALGVCPGNRSVGIALATRERLLRAHVITLHRVPAPSRASYLLGVLWSLVEEYQPARIAVVESGDTQTPSLLHRLWRWKARAVALGNVVATRYHAADVRDAQVGDRGRSTNRTLGKLLAERFPEISRRLHPSAEDSTMRHPWQTRSPQRTARERYNARTVLALAGALHDLDEELKSRLSL